MADIAPMPKMLLSAYRCGGCEVDGRDPAREPACWCCGGAVTVTARVEVPVHGERHTSPVSGMAHWYPGLQAE
jgi:hypothetical protein